MIYSKKGVSTIVANVLIVLLVIVGVAVIWAVVNPTLEKSAKGISAADCFDVDVRPVSCTVAGGSVVYERGAGSQSPLYGVRLVITRAGVATATTVTSNLPGELESKSQAIVNPIIQSGDKFNVAAIIGTAASNQVCEVLSEPVNCV